MNEETETNIGQFQKTPKNIDSIVPKNEDHLSAMDTIAGLLFLSLLLDFASALVSFFSVREYYYAGRVWGVVVPFVFEVITTIWVVSAMYEKRNWARKSFIVESALFLGLLVYLIPEGSLSREGGNLFVYVVDKISLVLTLICWLMCFGKNAKLDCEQHQRCQSVDPKRIYRECISYWIVLIVGWAVVFWGGSQYPRSDSEAEEYVDNCFEATMDGSLSAREQYIALLTSEMMENEGYSESTARHEAEKKIDMQIASFREGKVSRMSRWYDEISETYENLTNNEKKRPAKVGINLVMVGGGPLKTGGKIVLIIVVGVIVRLLLQ